MNTLLRKKDESGLPSNTNKDEIKHLGDFPGGPVAKTLCSQCRALRFDPGQGTRSHMPQLRVCMP